jgi:hypothetical protein
MIFDSEYNVALSHKVILQMYIAALITAPGSLNTCHSVMEG